MSERRVGIWFVGALGGVASTAALGIAALARGLTDTTSLVTATPLFERLPLADFGQFVIGGHDIRRSSFPQAVRELHERSGVFDASVIQACQPELETWSQNVRPGTAVAEAERVPNEVGKGEGRKTEDRKEPGRKAEAGTS